MNNVMRRLMYVVCMQYVYTSFMEALIFDSRRIVMIAWLDYYLIGPTWQGGFSHFWYTYNIKRCKKWESCTNIIICNTMQWLVFPIGADTQSSLWRSHLLCRTTFLVAASTVVRLLQISMQIITLFTNIAWSNNAILVIAESCNWGPKQQQAAFCKVAFRRSMTHAAGGGLHTNRNLSTLQQSVCMFHLV